MSFVADKVKVLGAEYRNVTVERGFFRNGDAAIQFRTESGELLATPSANLEGYGLTPSPGCLFIKNYSESRGIHRELIRLGIAEHTGRIARFGPFNAHAYEMRLSEDFISKTRKRSE